MLSLVLGLTAVLLFTPPSLSGQDEPAEEVGGLTVHPLAGPPGTEVQVEMGGLPPNTGVVIAFGGLRAGYQWVDEVASDEDGRLSEQVRVPDWADADETHYFFVKFPGQAPVATSPAFYLTGEDGRIRVRGEVTDEGREFPTLRGPDDELYCLGGEVAGFEPGNRVRIEGRLAESLDCPEGIPVEVDSHEPSR